MLRLFSGLVAVSLHFFRTDLVGATSMGDKMDGGLSVPDNTMERNTIRCFRCSESGHKVVDCRRKRGVQLKVFSGNLVMCSLINQESAPWHNRK